MPKKSRHQIRGEIFRFWDKSPLRQELWFFICSELLCCKALGILVAPNSSWVMGRKGGAGSILILPADPAQKIFASKVHSSKLFFTSVKFSVKMKNYTCKKGLLNWVSLFRGLAWRGTALRRCSEGPHWRAWVFCAHAVFLVAPPSSSQAAKVKETLKNLEWIGNLTRFNLTIFFSSKYCSDKSQPISVNCSEIRKFVNWKQV